MLEWSAYNGRQPGDPQRGVEVVLDIVRGEGVAKDKPFQKSIQLGSDCYAVAKAESEKALDRLEEWKE
ncbi:short-chain oxidoreductase, partial [Moniliophthora roreri MCA 2997]